MDNEDKEIKVTIGHAIKENRVAMGLTQQQLAKKLGVSTGIITTYEKGLKTPSDELKSKICSLFNISFNDLMGYPTYIELANQITNSLAKLNLSKQEFDYIYNKLNDFYCENGTYENFKKLEITTPNISKDKIQAFFGKESLLFTYCLDTILYHVFKKDRRKYLKEHPDEQIDNTFLRDNYTNTFKKALEKLNTDRILHKYDTPIYCTEQQRKTDTKGSIEELSMFIVGYLDNLSHNNSFSLLLHNESMIDRYRKGDIVVFNKQDTYSDNEELLIMLDKKLILTKIQITSGGIIIIAENNLPKLITKTEMKKLDFKVIGLPIEIKINYFNRNNDI